MKYPCLVQKIFCKTEIEVELEQEGVTRYGEPLPVFVWKGKCNYQDKGKTVLTAEKKLIQLSGCAMIPGDIAPELPVISGGTLVVFEKRDVSMKEQRKGIRMGQSTLQDWM